MTEFQYYLKIVNAIAAYTGVKVRDEDVQVARDPVVRGCWAARWAERGGAGEVLDCLFTDGIISADNLEEVQFAQWPPKSGVLKFFI
jgi:hypothetical protein